ncbi:hypothetical protein BGZ60DRAFT_431635 [Tricladium varicosporioides]|nr:hypothetical protein BGZ60DRAFT_431635 [Hymenoscyphus varicosporioides]
MSSLTSIVRLLESFVKMDEDNAKTLQISSPVDCTAGGGQSRWARLDEFESWHALQISWLQHRNPQPTLENICIEVAKCLESATSGTRRLKNKFSEGIRSTADYQEARYLILQALDDVIRALKEFEVVALNQTLQDSENLLLIKEYFKGVLKLSIILGQLLDGTDKYESWFAAFEGEISNEFKTFRFDSLQTDFAQVDNPHLSGVIVDPNSIPASYTPVGPTPPRLVLNDNFYGPSILSNEPE